MSKVTVHYEAVDTTGPYWNESAEIMLDTLPEWFAEKLLETKRFLVIVGIERVMPPVEK
jgi:hypothetical protein